MNGILACVLFVLLISLIVSVCYLWNNYNYNYSLNELTDMLFIKFIDTPCPIQNVPVIIPDHIKEHFEITLFNNNTKWICFPCCRKAFDVLLIGIKSFSDNNSNVNFVIFNNNELTRKDFEIIEKALQGKNKLLVVDISPWMNIFKDCLPLKSQLNNYIRLLMPLFFQKYLPNVDRFMYCDEDCYCVGKIDKLYNIDFDKDIAGFIDIVSSRNENNVSVLDLIDFKYIPERNYINTGLLMFKTSFDIKKIIKELNMSITYNGVLVPSDIKTLTHDQFVLNLYPHSIIPLTISNENRILHNNKTKGEEIITQCFKDYNCAHTYAWKNNVQLMRKRNILKHF